MGVARKLRDELVLGRGRGRADQDVVAGLRAVRRAGRPDYCERSTGVVWSIDDPNVRWGDGRGEPGTRNTETEKAEQQDGG
jgi:hypothetical protein